MKKEIPNVDGQYATKDGSLKITVTRKSIQIETTSVSSGVHIIDDDQSGPKKGGPDGMDRITNAMNKSIKLLGF